MWFLSSAANAGLAERGPRSHSTAALIFSLPAQLKTRLALYFRDHIYTHCETLMNLSLIDDLQRFPAQLEQLFAAFPQTHTHWAPPSWDGVPSESFTAIEQICHVRDIEIDGYHVRFRRLLEEDQPGLASIDSYAVARDRDYAGASPVEVFRRFRQGRAETVKLLASLDDAQWARRGVFEGYGPVTVRGLAHFLCSHDQQHLAGMHWLLGQIAART
jgi:hypothetical protein